MNAERTWNTMIATAITACGHRVLARNPTRKHPDSPFEEMFVEVDDPIPRARDHDRIHEEEVTRMVDEEEVGPDCPPVDEFDEAELPSPAENKPHENQGWPSGEDDAASEDHVDVCSCARIASTICRYSASASEVSGISSRDVV